MTSYMGTPVPRLEDESLLRGQGRYVDDVQLPGLLHAAFVRSPYAHALVRRVDPVAARQLPGVAAVLSLKDLAPVLASTRMRTSRSGKQSEDIAPHVLADGEVCYVGEPVAIVVAESRYVAEDAAMLVEVEYDPLSPVADCVKATENSAPVACSTATANLLNRYTVSYGDAEAAFRTAPHVYAEDYLQHRGGAHSMEGRGLAAEWRTSDGTLTVWASTQKAHDMAQMLGDMLGLDETQLKVVTPAVGGGFGPKLLTYQEDIAVAAAAVLLRRTVKWIEDRREHFLGAVQERDQVWRMEIAVDAEARIRGVRGQLVHDQGAYALQDMNLPYNSATAVTGPYVVPAFSMEVLIARTNKVPVSSVRGAGYPQPVFAMERLLDRVACELNIDRAEVRRRNLVPADKMPYEKPLKARSGAAIVYDSGDYPASQAKVLEAAGWSAFPARQAEARAAGRYIGIGLANAVKGTGRGPFESGLVRVLPSGRVAVHTGAAEIGQGLSTALAQICADQLGLAPRDVEVCCGNTGTVALGLGAFASRQLVTAGSSVLLAAQAVAEKARALASHILRVSVEKVELVDGLARVVGEPERQVRLADLARTLRGAPGYAFPEGLEPGLEAIFHFRTDALAYANASHVAEVEVDVETGAVKILRYVALQDCGRLINPMIVEGQVQGGIAHGLSNALFEWMGYDESAQPVTTNFAEYLLVTATELPRFETHYTQTPSPLNPLGAKGVGEVGTVPAAAAVISAIENALQPFGVRIARTPVRPHELVELIRSGREAAQ